MVSSHVDNDTLDLSTAISLIRQISSAEIDVRPMSSGKIDDSSIQQDTEVLIRIPSLEVVDLSILLFRWHSAFFPLCWNRQGL